MTQEKVARVHSHQSYRAKLRDTGDRKVTFKGVLDNPHRVLWPTVPANVQNAILAHLLDLLDGVAAFYQSRCRSSKKRKRASEVVNELSHRNTKRRASPGDPTIDQDDLIEGPSTLSSDHAEKPGPPPILNSLIYGINAVTRRLEDQIEHSRVKLVFKSDSETKAAEEVIDPIRFLFVCRADIDPPILIDHLPHLVATYNTLRQKIFYPIVLATLPKGAELILAQAMGVRRLAALAISASSIISRERLATVVDSLAPLTAPWLSSSPAGSYIQTHIKQIRTTAPRDMKAAKESRVKGRAVAKIRRSKLRKADVVAEDASTSDQPVSRVSRVDVAISS